MLKTNENSSPNKQTIKTKQTPRQYSEEFRWRRFKTTITMRKMMKINWKRWQHCFCIRRAEFVNVCSKMMIYNSAMKKIYTLNKTSVRFRSGQGFPDHILLLSENVDSLKLHLLFTAKSLNSVHCGLHSSGPEWNIWWKTDSCRAEAGVSLANQIKHLPAV